MGAFCVVGTTNAKRVKKRAVKPRARGLRGLGLAPAELETASRLRRQPQLGAAHSNEKARPFSTVLKFQEQINRSAEMLQLTSHRKRGSVSDQFFRTTAHKLRAPGEIQYHDHFFNKERYL